MIIYNRIKILEWIIIIGKRLSEIEGFDGLGVLVKFLNQEYLSDLLDGNIYMNNYKYFIELENKTKQKGQGDKLELAHVFRSKSIKIIDPESDMVIGTASSAEVIERYNELPAIPIFCVTYFKANDFLVVGIENGDIVAKIDLPPEDVLLFEQTFGDTAVVLSNEFKEKMKRASKDVSRLAIGEVIYHDYDYYSEERKAEYDDMAINIFFWKDIYFKQQREVRFVLIDKFVDKNFTLEIGDIRDKSKVLNTKDLLTNHEFVFPFKS